MRAPEMPDATFTLPLDYRRIAVVDRFADLVATPLAGEINAVCWRRTLAGDFGEVAASVAAAGGVTEVDADRLAALRCSAAGRVAIETLRADLRQLRELGHEPTLEWVRGYPRDDDPDGLPTDVYSFHVDSATVPTETFLCTYSGLPSEGLRNDEAVPRVQVPASRRALLARFGGAEGPAFEAFLQEHCHALHYAPAPGATPFSFGVGNLWRIAVAHPASAVPACIHRAPADRPDGQPRLLLIS